MSVEVLAIVILVGLLAVLVLGIEISIGFGIIGALGLFFLLSQPQSQIALSAWATLNIGTLTAVPLFVFMGAILSNSGIITVLFDGVNKWLGGLPGGLACSVLGSCAMFGAMSGSNVAAAAVFGKAVYPEMEKQHYDPVLSLATIAIGGTLAVLIPPSLILIIYGAWQEVSIPRLFAAGLIPGIVLSAMLILTIMFLVWRNPALAPKPVKYSWRVKFTALKELAPWLVMIFLVLGVIFGGIMTATEAAALGAFLSLVLALFYKKMSYQILKNSFLEAVKVTSALMFIIAMARVLVFVFHRIGITEVVANGIISLELGHFGTIALIYGFYLILGMFFDAISMMTLTLPFIIPVIIHMNISLVWFGIAYVVVAEIGMVTPPFGLNLFVLQSVVPKHSILAVARGCVPFIITTLVFMALLTAFPEMALWLPKVMF